MFVAQQLDRGEPGRCQVSELDDMNRLRLISEKRNAELETQLQACETSLRFWDLGQSHYWTEYRTAGSAVPAER
jgi:hypothetical protein